MTACAAMKPKRAMRTNFRWSQRRKDSAIGREEIAPRARNLSNTGDSRSLRRTQSEIARSPAERRNGTRQPHCAKAVSPSAERVASAARVEVIVKPFFAFLVGAVVVAAVALGLGYAGDRVSFAVVATVLIGLCCLVWLVVIVVLPWNTDVQARHLLNEIARARDCGVEVAPAQEQKADAVARL